jgi:DNA gyrase subunit A
MSENVHLQDTNITEVMETAYIDYSMSVIVSRALPDMRDGLKPVQRRILYAMLREGLLHNRPFDKCAGVVGEVLKNYHPHGDASVYDTLVRLAQNWVMRLPLVDPQGNFGSIDGDNAAAYRYTECRLTEGAEALLREIDEDTVDFVPNYKESTTEPSVLPAALPHLLINGSTGIAVGMTTNIPPHNVQEIIDATIALIDDSNLSIDALAKIIKGPDFPTGGIISGYEGIREYLHSGRGIVRVRGKVQIEDGKAGRETVVITEIPYNVNRANLVTRIAELVGEKVLTEISDLRDESDEQTRIVIELKRGESARVLINKLYKHTPLEHSFGVILLALDQRRPKQMSIKAMLQGYIEHRREVVLRRTRHRLQKAQDRAHLLEGYKMALLNLDDFVKIIRAASSRDAAKAVLMAKYPLSERQVQAILEMRLYQLTGMEVDKIEAEYAELLAKIETFQGILGSESQLFGLIKNELLELRQQFASPRKTQVVPAEGELRMEDIIPNEGCVITVSHEGFIKRTSLQAYRSQRRGGKGVIAAGQHEEDFIEHLFTASTHDYILFFMNNGRVYVEKVYEIPEGSRTAKGRALVNVLSLQSDEKIASMICAKSFSDQAHLVLCTRKGVVKKTTLADYSNFRKGGIIGIRLDADDSLVAAKLTQGQDELILVTASGMSIRFSEEDLKEQGRATRGVRGISLKKDDIVQAMEVVDPASTLLIAGQNGLGKRSAFDEYRVQGRGGSGVIAIRTERVAAALSVQPTDEVMLLTQQGQAVRIAMRDIRVIGRSTQGVRLIDLSPGDKLVGVSKVIAGDDDIPASLLANLEANETPV